MKEQVFKKLVEIATGKKAKIFWAVVIGIVVGVLMLYPYIDANVLVFRRLEQRIEILDKITKLEISVISSNEILQQEYDSILAELEVARDKSIVNMTNVNDTIHDKRIKFISGGLLLWILSLLILFSKSKKEISKLRKVFNNIASFLLCVGFGYVFAVIGRTIPTFWNAWVNAVVFPIIQIVFIALLVYGTKDK